MRRILVDNARRKRRPKHGGDRTRIAARRPSPSPPRTADDLLALDEALTELAAQEPLKAELVKLRYFAGLTVEEAAAGPGHLPGRPPSATGPYARAWLYAALAEATRRGARARIIPAAVIALVLKFSHCALRPTLRQEHRTMAHDDASFDTHLLRAPIEIARDEERACVPRRRLRRRDEVLRRRVETLVDAHFQAGSFLEDPRLALARTAAIGPGRRRPSGPARSIGPYKLLQPIGEGGMGTVYMAEQTAAGPADWSP